MHGLSLVTVSGARSLVAVGGLLIVTSLIAKHRLYHAWASVVVVHGLSCPQHENLPRPGIKPRSPAMAGSYLSTVPPGESFILVVICVSLTANELEHLFMFLFAVPFAKVPVQVFCSSFNWIFFLIVSF